MGHVTPPQAAWLDLQAEAGEQEGTTHRASQTCQA